MDGRTRSRGSSSRFARLVRVVLEAASWEVGGRMSSVGWKEFFETEFWRYLTKRSICEVTVE